MNTINIKYIIYFVVITVFLSNKSYAGVSLCDGDKNQITEDSFSCTKEFNDSYKFSMNIVSIPNNSRYIVKPVFHVVSGKDNDSETSNFKAGLKKSTLRTLISSKNNLVGDVTEDGLVISAINGWTYYDNDSEECKSTISFPEKSLVASGLLIKKQRPNNDDNLAEAVFFQDNNKMSFSFNKDGDREFRNIFEEKFKRSYLSAVSFYENGALVSRLPTKEHLTGNMEWAFGTDGLFLKDGECRKGLMDNAPGDKFGFGTSEKMSILAFNDDRILLVGTSGEDIKKFGDICTFFEDQNMDFATALDGGGACLRSYYKFGGG